MAQKKLNYFTKSEKREAKRNRRKRGMQVDGRSVKRLQELIEEKAKK